MKYRSFFLFDPGAPIGSYLENVVGEYNTMIWLAPLKWNQAGYDAVFIDTVLKKVRFVQVTQASNHKKFHHYYFVEVLNRLAAEKDLNLFEVVEMCLLVPECNLGTFQTPTDVLDFENNILKVAGAPERTTRESSSGSGLPFEKCKVEIMILGVEFTPGTIFGWMDHV
ncbi:unnamed protein product [Phytophthora fragariaefolia]|uniref:Unnamed protein product n=1 Tax=Phytophthora fragariaefolia TaxID=1490495 RepID=A0A9W6Y8X3_9STRA|nr:unnamed protein product [Phytophthora fragariaefolia]